MTILVQDWLSGEREIAGAADLAPLEDQKAGVETPNRASPTESATHADYTRLSPFNAENR